MNAELRAHGYTFLKKIGQGSTSNVYLVQYEKDKKQYACKVISRKLLENRTVLCCLERELRIHRNINHNNIIKLWNVVYTKENVCLILDYCPNGDLFQYIYENKGFDRIDALKILKQLLNALNYLHSRKVAHCDIKPENILFDDKYNVKLSDYHRGKFYRFFSFYGI